MAFPIPAPGLVISYAYLWWHEHAEGHGEGRKNRPCVIVVAVENKEGATVVTVAPITHSAPLDASVGIEIPPRVKQHLGLDDERSWVLLQEVNTFTWPGYDLRPIASGETRIDYGFLPPKLFDRLREAMLELIVQRRRDSTSRSHGRSQHRVN